MKITLVLFISLIFYTQQSSQKNILGLFPHFGYSHFKVFSPILRELSEQGHKVTVVSYFPNKNFHPNYTDILLIKPPGEHQTIETSIHAFDIRNFTPTRSLLVMFQEFMALHKEGQRSCRDFYKSGAVQKIMEYHSKEPFDIAIGENFNTDCYLGVTHMLKLPVIGISSCALMPWYYDRIALPDTPSYVQTEFVGFPDKLNWHQRLINFIVTKACKIAYRYYTNWKDNQIIKEFLNIDVDVDQIANDNTSFILLNQHYSLIGNRPSTPQLIEIGGVHITEKDEPLPINIEEFLSKSPNGVLFISFGSMLKGSSFPIDKLNMIIEVLQKIPLRIIWKWESDQLPIKNDEKFLFIKWAPQKQILCQPKVKIFWGHGGLLGVTETVYCAKPMIVTPIYGDQFLNGNAIQNRQIGKILHFNDITRENLMFILQEIMSEKFADNAALISKIFRNRDMPPLQKAIWWIEHVLENKKYGIDIMRVKSFNMPWIFFYSIDCILIILIILLIPVYIGMKLASFVTKKGNTKKHSD